MNCLAWVLFRAEGLGQAFGYISRIIFNFNTGFGFSIPIGFSRLALTFILIEWVGRSNQFGLQVISKIQSKGVRWTIYLGIIALIGVFKRESQEFIYFQF
jgi:hypothetical protein